MTRRLFCHHGHILPLPKISTEIGTVVCPLCGAVTKCKATDETHRGGLIEKTPGSNGNPTKVSDSKLTALASLIATSESIDDIGAQDDQAIMMTLDSESALHKLAKSAPREDSAQFKQEPTAEIPSSGSARGRAEEQFEPPSLTGYTVMEELGRGGMGVVYRARDELQGREVALKTLQRMNPDNLQRFKQEFRSLADIAHPNLASLYALLSDGETWCFSMEILEGVEFLEYVWSGFAALEKENQPPELGAANDADTRFSPARIHRLQEALTQLAVGVHALHKAGILHCDIKPSNVLMTREERLVLLDFGLVSDMQQKDESGDARRVRGTPSYMSPEQANAERLTSASDWYAVGVMLYEALTGHLPFHGSSLQIIQRKRSETPVSPRKFAADVPDHLHDLCMALLDRDPKNRPAAQEILRCLGADELADKLFAAQRAAKRSVELVGREQHSEILKQSFVEVCQGNTRSVFIHGKSGMGKSVLVRNFLNGIQHRYEAVLLEGRCYEQESVPFKALDSLIDSLAVFLNTLTEDIVASVMPRDRMALTRVFPVLGGVPEIAGATYPSIANTDQQELRQRAMNALRELLQRLAIRIPLVLYVDDLQWGDVDSAGLLADLVRPPDAPRMLLLLSYRSEDRDRSSCLKALIEAYSKGQQLPHRQELSVESLSEGESSRLALMLLGKNDEVNQIHAKKIADESGGWPFFVWELVQHIQEDPDIAVQSLDLDEVIWSRVQRLPQDTPRMLELIAVAGLPMPVAEIYQALDAVSTGPSLLSQLRASNFVRTTESEQEETVVETYHDRVRESVLKHLDTATIKQHNLNLAVVIERVSGIKIDAVEAHIAGTSGFEEPHEHFELDKQQWQRVFDLAYFFDAAGEDQRAFPYALVAAEQARSQNALEVAEQQFRIALKGATRKSVEMRFRVHEGLGDVLVFRGQYDEAKEQFEMARALVEGNLLLARLDYKLGEASFKKGDMGDARDYFEKAIRQLGQRPPTTLTVMPRALKEAFVQFLHTRFPGIFVGRKDPQSPQGQLDLFRARVYDQLAFSYWFTRGMKFVLWSHLRHMNLAELYPPSPELGKTYAFHAVTMTGIPMARRGIAYAKKAYEISVDKGDLWGQGKARSYHTFACIVLARFKEGIETGREAVDLLQQAGDVWESNMARMIATVPMYHSGDLKSSYREAKKAYEIGHETGDYSAVCISLLFWIPNKPQTIPAGAIQTELERQREDPLTIAAAVYARGLELLLCDDQPKEAAQVLQESLDRAKKLGLRNVCLFSAVTWKATALRIAAEREPEGTARKRALREATQAVRAALKITEKYQACRPHALREQGMIAASAGEQDQARRFFDVSLRVADAQEARYERAKTLLARGEAGLKFGWPEAAKQIEQARSTIAAIEDF
jgi:serine/threonine protein kinase/tetratricopeptide (TPR) repeat protein